MKKHFLLLTAALGTLFLGGCVYDEGGYSSVGASYSSGGGGYYGRYDDNSPYYSHGGRRYYSDNGRYAYYNQGRPVYVNSVPYGASYITPQQYYRNRAEINQYRNQQTVNRDQYKYQQKQYGYNQKQQQYQNQVAVNQYRNQQTINKNQYKYQQKQQQYNAQQQQAQYKYQQQAVTKRKKKKNDD